MGICKLCGEYSILTIAFYAGAFVCPKCYKLLDENPINNPYRLKLRKKLFMEENR